MDFRFGFFLHYHGWYTQIFAYTCPHFLSLSLSFFFIFVERIVGNGNEEKRTTFDRQEINYHLDDVVGVRDAKPRPIFAGLLITPAIRR